MYSQIIYYIIIWEMPLFNPLNQATGGTEPTFFPPLLVPFQMPEMATPLWETQEAPTSFSTMMHVNARESPPQVVPNINASASHVTLPPRTPPHRHLSPNLEEEVSLRELEEGVELMRETWTEIVVLKDIKVIVFKERLKKKTHTHLSTKSIKKLHRYSSSDKFGDRKLCSSTESIVNNSELNEPGKGDSCENTTSNKQINELNLMELLRL